MKSTNDMTEILIQDKPTYQIIAEAFEQKKMKMKSFSLENLTRKSSIPNKSNLHEMLKGRRKIPKRYRLMLLESLDIRGINRTYMLKKIECEYAKKQDKELLEEVKILRKALLVKTIDENLAVSMKAFKVFCALGLLPEDNASVFSLEKVLAGWDKKEVAHYLSELEKADVISIHRGSIEVKNLNVLFNSKQGLRTSIGPQLIKHFLSTSMNSVDDLYNHQDTLFSSSIISVKREDYLEELEKFRQSLLKFRVEIEAKNADELVTINVQMYPLKLNQ